MKYVYALVVLVLCSSIQINGMDQYKGNEIALEGLNKRAAQVIFDSLARLSNKFGKVYDPNASKGANSALELTSFVADLKDKTKDFPQLFAVAINIEQAIEKNDGKLFWQEEGQLRSLLRPTFQLSDTKKVQSVGWYEALKLYVFGKQKKELSLDVPVAQELPKSQGYIAKAVGSVTGAVSNFYNWLFSGQGFQVE